VLAAQIWRRPDREPRRPRRRSWLIFFISAAVLTVVFFGLGQYWQYLIRGLMGVTEYNIALVVASPFVAALVFCLILLIGRGLRGLYHWVAHLLHRWMGQRAARAIGWGLVAGLTYVVVTGLLFDGFVNAMNSAYSLRDTKTAEGVHQPTTGLPSGGPGSVIPWDTLGWQGRNFTGEGPSVSDIEKATGHPAMEPIRIYSGLASASDAEARSALAVRDLERAGGFQRKYLLVVSTTGSGWVDPALSDSFEYLTGGDSAIVALQYSYLPSWISYLVDQSTAREAGRALFDAVYGPWSQLPQDKRPRLLVAGESLGSFGGETAFSGEHSLANLTDGALFAGPPNFNTLFREFSDHRDAYSQRSSPSITRRRIVRFADDATTDVPPDGQPWLPAGSQYMCTRPTRSSGGARTWSSATPTGIQRASRQGRARGHLLDSPRDLLAGHRRPSVRHRRPGSTGHKYTSEYVDGFNAIMRPAGITPQDLTDLRKIIASEK
jgi:uncharacterized membrane protein